MRLSGGPPKVICWAEMEGVQPLATPEDCELAEALAKADPEVQVRAASSGDAVPPAAALLYPAFDLYNCRALYY